MGLTLPIAAQAQTAPAAVTARMTQLDAACRRAGGRPVEQAYVQVRDFTGDARPDFLIAEGDYVCAGRPGLFDAAPGEASIDIYVVDERGGAYRAYRQQVRSFRVIDTTPRQLEVTLGASACPRLQLDCGATLAWNAAAGRFDDQPPPPVAMRPPPRAPSASAAHETQAAFQARCQREMIAANPAARRWAAEECRQVWSRAAASGQAADVLMSVARARSAGPMTLGQIQAASAPVRWTRAQAGTAEGSLGRFAAGIDLRAGTLSVNWAAVGQPIPFDIAEALRVRGAGLALIACQAFSAGEQTRVYRMTGPGQSPVGLTIYAREAPTANANSTYGATLELARPPATLAALRAREPDDGWAATCEN